MSELQSTVFAAPRPSLHAVLCFEIHPSLDGFAPESCIEVPANCTISDQRAKPWPRTRSVMLSDAKYGFREGTKRPQATRQHSGTGHTKSPENEVTTIQIRRGWTVVMGDVVFADVQLDTIKLLVTKQTRYHNSSCSRRATSNKKISAQSYLDFDSWVSCL